MELKYHYTAAPGYTQLVTPQTHPINDLSFGMLRLEGGHAYQTTSAGYEIGLVILTGRCSIRVDDQTFEHLGERASVFDGSATGVYVPCAPHSPGCNRWCLAWRHPRVSAIVWGWQRRGRRVRFNEYSAKCRAVPLPLFLLSNRFGRCSVPAERQKPC